MRSFLVIALVATLSAYATADDSSFCANSMTQIDSLLDGVDKLLFTAYQKKNGAAIMQLENAQDMLLTVGAKCKDPESLNEAERKLLSDSVAYVEANLGKLENMVNSNIKTRGWIQNTMNFVGQRAALLGGLANQAISLFNNNKGLAGVASLLKPFLDELMKNPQIAQVAGGLKTLQTGINAINSMTGGSIAPMKDVSNILANIDMVGDFIQNAESANSTEAVIDSWIAALVKSESANAEKVKQGMDVICSGLTEAQASA